MITIPNVYAEPSKSYPQAYEPYKISRCTINTGPGMVKYVMVESPMDHGTFKRHYRRLGQIGIMVPMIDMVNCGLSSMELLTTPAGRSWMERTPPDRRLRHMSDINQISRELKSVFNGVLKSFNMACKAVEYCDGLMVLEVRKVVDWNQLNRFDLTV